MSGVRSAPSGPPRLTRRETKAWLMDMDGVLVHEEHAIPGADRFLPYRASLIIESVADPVEALE